MNDFISIINNGRRHHLRLDSIAGMTEWEEEGNIHLWINFGSGRNYMDLIFTTIEERDNLVKTILERGK